ncbi:MULTISPECIES: MFS transporter [unclassified Paenibacillus]|uniref:MFS transporter n=1 Tax=unclassified Paenibacillus TaxID=185978 RepID=UPI0009A8900E|nr:MULTISPECIES: MFS transporter [unclassified Paenibacillus]SLJ90396.1 Major Facilitator Superfamily protein [Paenibacillus sp. RU5A]SOC59013.1 Major Facilitator Superfamily protein [Paenibacillus sp. RU26A]SOC68064.1 Major Facilitator Superfamily protein [Paenibacillus sp. RU5M]
MKQMENKSFGKFLMVWFGQLISTMGIGMTAFSLGVYAFEKTHMATAVALITLFTFLPNILLRPIGGVLADRFDRRMMMVIGDLGSAGGLVFIWIMILIGNIELWYLYVGVTFCSVFSAIQSPAYKASATDLLDKDQYSKGSGLMQLAESSKFLFSPIIAGILLSITTIEVILVINMLTYMVAILAVLVIRKSNKAARSDDERKPWLVELNDGWIEVTTNKGVLLLVIIISIITFYLGFLETLIGPMILSFSDSRMLGTFLSMSAIGMLISSLCIGMFTKSKKYSKILVLGLVMSGISFSLLGFSTNIFIIIFAGFLFLASLPFVNMSADVLVRNNISNEKQGRVWGIIGILSQLGFIVSYSLAVFLADRVFNPLLVEGGALASTVGSYIGVGPGRGIALLFIIAGVFVIAIAAITSQLKSIKGLEKGIDIVPTDPTNLAHD